MQVGYTPSMPLDLEARLALLDGIAVKFRRWKIEKKRSDIQIKKNSAFTEKVPTLDIECGKASIEFKFRDAKLDLRITVGGVKSDPSYLYESQSMFDEIEQALREHTGIGFTL